MAGHRVTRGTHRVDITPLDLPTGGDEAALRHETTVRCNDALGAAILAHPDQYFWYHRRWRGEES